jgi:uncharacterized protein (DUF4415 family)
MLTPLVVGSQCGCAFFSFAQNAAKQACPTLARRTDHAYQGAHTIRLSPKVVETFRATGTGWQTRMDAALQDWIKAHAL